MAKVVILFVLLHDLGPLFNFAHFFASKDRFQVEIQDFITIDEVNGDNYHLWYAFRELIDSVILEILQTQLL